MPDDLISIREAAARGIDRLRLPHWANALDHLKIDIIEKEPGPWTHLYSPMNVYMKSRDPVNILCINIDYDEKSYVSYTGPLPDSKEYKTEADRWAAAESFIAHRRAEREQS